jgi:hypothetical protein
MFMWIILAALAFGAVFDGWVRSKRLMVFYRPLELKPMYPDPDAAKL